MREHRGEEVASFTSFNSRMIQVRQLAHKENMIIPLPLFTDILKMRVLGS